MRSFIAFVKKEFSEGLRTYKIFILAMVYLLFGFMNPIVAKVTPDLLKTLMPEGITINMPDPSAIDSWAQFFKNISQMGLLVLVIIFSGLVANEFDKGTLVNLLTKGLSRSTVILAKFSSAVVVWTFCYGLCFVVTDVYTAYFWSMAGISNLFLSVFGLWLFGILLIALIIFGGVLFKTVYGSMLLTGGVVVLMMVINIAPKLQKFNPATISSSNVALLTTQTTNADFISASLVCCGAIIVLVIASIFVLDRKQI
jgi:ABC-2 type transport system permease protein